jgi:hypothetical protein
MGCISSKPDQKVKTHQSEDLRQNDIEFGPTFSVTPLKINK